jgi:hypothetical protein
VHFEEGVELVDFGVSLGWCWNEMMLWLWSVEKELRGALY